MTEYRDEFSDLLGAFALDAVDPDERLEIETHLRTCPWCAAEVVEHREVAAALSHSGADAPPGVWDKIAAELAPPAPPMRLTVTPPAEPAKAVDEAVPAAPENVVSLADRRKIRTRTAAAVLSVAALLLAVVGFVAVSQYQDASNLREQATMVTTPGPGDLTVSLTGDSSDAGAQAIVNDQGEGVLVPQDLPDPGEDRLYQLWGRVDGVVLSLGTFDADTEVVRFQVKPDQVDRMDLVAVTEEQSPGVLASENPPVIFGETV